MNGKNGMKFDLNNRKDRKSLLEAVKGNNRKTAEKKVNKSENKDRTAAENTQGKKKLPNLDKIGNVKRTDDEEVQERYKERKTWAEKAGQKLFPIEKRIKEIKRDQRLAFVLELQKELRDLEQNKEKILKGVDQSLLSHTRFSAFYEEIRWTGDNPSGPEPIGKIINRLLEEKRTEKVPDKPPQGHWIFWTGQYYKELPDPETGEISPGTTALMLETIKAINSEKRRYGKELKAIIQEMKKNPSITGIGPENGLYSGYVPSKNGRRGSYITVRVLDEKIIRPVVATGFLNKLFQTIKKEEGYITVFSLKEEKLKIRQILPDDKFYNLVKFWRSLKEAEEIK